MNLGRIDVDNIIRAMATERTNVNIRIAKIITHEHKVIDKVIEKQPEKPVDIIGGISDTPPSPDTSKRTNYPNSTYAQLSPQLNTVIASQ
jgi:hypothetical protein